jgi:hypothetical protein
MIDGLLQSGGDFYSEADSNEDLSESQEFGVPKESV